MAFRVVITKPAQEDIESSVDFIAIDSIEAAIRWYEGLRASVQELEEMPHRFAPLQDLGEMDLIFRAFPYHSHRVIYHVDDASKVVYIARVYHAARRSLSDRDLV